MTLRGALLALATASGLAVAGPARAVEMLPEIVAWVAGETGLPASGLPRVAFARPSRIAEMPGARAAEIVAVYHRETATIYLAEGWTGATPAEISVLVHEVVHHLQDAAGVIAACPQARERQAYEVQDRWLAQHGQSLESAFGIDAMTLLARTTCVP